MFSIGVFFFLKGKNICLVKKKKSRKALSRKKNDKFGRQNNFSKCIAIFTVDAEQVFYFFITIFSLVLKKRF